MIDCCANTWFVARIFFLLIDSLSLAFENARLTQTRIVATRNFKVT